MLIRYLTKIGTNDTKFHQKFCYNKSVIVHIFIIHHFVDSSHFEFARNAGKNFGVYSLTADQDVIRPIPALHAPAVSEQFLHHFNFLYLID